MGEIKIGERIRELRGSRGISQETLADVCNVSMQAVSKWENGQSYPDITFLPLLAEYFQVTTDYLLTGRKEAIAGEYAQADGGNEQIADMLRDKTEEDVLYIVQYRNGKILDKKEWNEGGINNNEEAIKVIFEEEFQKIEKGLSVEIWGNANIETKNIRMDIKAGANVNCGMLEGDISAGGEVNCDAVEGDVKAGASVNCGAVNGNVHAGSDVDCGTVNGDVNAGSDVNCSDVEGDAKAGCAIKCNIIKGDAKAGMSIECETIEGDASANVFR